MTGFDWPWVLAALPLPILVRFLLRPAPIAGALALPIAGELRALASERPQPRWRVGALAFLTWIFLVVAGAQPRWTGEPVTLPVTARDLLLAVDVSGSMGERDMYFEKNYLSRLETLQRVAGEFIERREGDRIGLILFGTHAYLYAPLSLDRQTVAQLLAESEIGLAGERTAIGDAIGVAVKYLPESAVPHRVLILLTDGVNTTGNVAPEKAAELAAANDIRIHTIGFGAVSAQDEYSRILRGQIQPTFDEPQLKHIARRTGGRYFRARNVGELQQVYRVLDQIEPVEVNVRTFRPTRSLFHWPLAAAFALALVVVVRRRIGP
jgi:Ca-activated chloride channel family protein